MSFLERLVNEMVPVNGYADMKDSGIEWIGKIPTHWKVGKVKSVFSSTKTIVGNDVDSYQRLALTLNGVIKRSKADDTGLQPEKFETYQILRSNELVFKLIDLQNVSTSRVGRSSYDGIVSPAYIVLHEKSEHSTKYAEYFFLAMWMHQIFNQLGADGVRSNIGTSALLNLPFIIVPYEEQAIIASYLDTQCNRINEIIQEAKVSIEDYKFWKASIIFEAVTKGLDPNVKMKDSGVKWIGEVPKSWNITKIRNFVSIRSGITLGKQYPAGTQLIPRPYLRVANVKAEYLDLNDVATIMVTKEEAEKYALSPGELLMTEGGDRDKLGRGTIWNGEIPECLHQNHVFAVRVNEKFMLTEYLSYLTASSVGRVYFDITAKKTTNLASTNSTTILQFTVPVPSLEEQRKIVEMLNQKYASINEIIDEKQKLIDDLESYKKSLIFEVVTGKKRVV